MGYILLCAVKGNYIRIGDKSDILLLLLLHSFYIAHYLILKLLQTLLSIYLDVL